MNLGPLTTIFTPPLDCQNQGLEIESWVTRRNTLDTYVDSTIYYLTAGPGSQTCFPASRKPSSTQYYSPGRCPQGYSTACTEEIVYSIASSTETVATCCPTGFSFRCATNTPGRTSDWGVVAGCTVLSNPHSSGLVEVPDAVVNGWGLQVRWQSVDGPLLGITSSISTTSAETSMTPILTSTPMPTSTAPPAEPASALTSGAIAGICIGTIIGALILVGLAWNIFLIKKRQRCQQATLGQDSVEHGKTEQASSNNQQTHLYCNPGVPQLSGVSVAGVSVEHELRASLPGAGDMAELPNIQPTSRPSELQG